MNVEINKNGGMALLKRLFNFSGRASLKEFWLTFAGIVLFDVVLGVIGGVLTAIYDPLFILVVPFFLAAAVAGIAVYVRRLHDIGLSGFWVFYLSPLGLPFIYVAYIMNADESACHSISRIKEVGSPWLSWILAAVLWWMGWMFGAFFVLLCPGQKADNSFGSNPYVKNETTVDA